MLIDMLAVWRTGGNLRCWNLITSKLRFVKLFRHIVIAISYMCFYILALAGNVLGSREGHQVNCKLHSSLWCWMVFIGPLNSGVMLLADLSELFGVSIGPMLFSPHKLRGWWGWIIIWFEKYGKLEEVDRTKSCHIDIDWWEDWANKDDIRFSRC